LYKFNFTPFLFETDRSGAVYQQKVMLPLRVFNAAKV